MGTVLHRADSALRETESPRFSPLLDGDGVASVNTSRLGMSIGSFSPLLDGDGVASHGTGS